MALTNKFSYPSLNRETTTEGRKYISPSGEKLPSVTTILEATKPLEAKKALIEWRRRVGEQKAKEITAEAAGRGTRMHKWIENYINDDATGEPGGHPASKHSHKMANIIIEQGLSNCQEFWGTEVALFYPSIYAGTTDLVGVHADSPAIMDHKQSNKLKKQEWIDDYFLQLVAYANAHNQVYGTDIRKGVIFMCTADLQYQEFIIEGNEFDRWTDSWFKRLEEFYIKFL